MTPCLTPRDLDAVFRGRAPTEAERHHARECVGCAAALREATAATTESEAVVSRAQGVSAATLGAVPLEEPGRYRRVLVDGQPTLLGAGGYARVELARDEVIGRDVALKTLRSAQLASPRRHLTERRLLQEARVVGQLEHPAIVPLYDLARTAEGELFYAMRRIRGRTLAAAIAEAPTSTRGCACCRTCWRPVTPSPTPTRAGCCTAT